MRRIFAVCMSALICFSIAACAPKQNKTEEFNIVTSFYPIYVFTSNIANGAKNAKVTNLTPSNTGCLHDYTVTPEDMKNLENADVFVINGAGMEKFIKNVPQTLAVVDSSEGIDLLKDDDEINAHIWMSVKNAMIQVENITDGLCKANPENAQIYKKNSKAYLEKLTTLDSEAESTVKNVKQKNIITFHEAFDYFARDYGLNIAAAIHSDSESEPGAAHIADIVKLIKKEDIAAVFTEPQYSDKSARVIERETGIQVFELDSIVTGEMTLDAYETAMRKNIEIIRKAL